MDSTNDRVNGAPVSRLQTALVADTREDLNHQSYKLLYAELAHLENAALLGS